MVMDAYVAMSKLYLPEQIYNTWFGEGGLMSDPGTISDASESAGMQHPPRVRQEVP